MKIRFLETWPSSNPDYPFMPGQIVTVDAPTQEMRQALQGGSAEVVRAEAPELAVVGTGEQAVTRQSKKRQREHRDA